MSAIPSSLLLPKERATLDWQMCPQRLLSITLAIW
jgi:hypothetical protein